MKFKFLAACALAATLYSCDDTTTGIGQFVIDTDEIISTGKAYSLDTRTVQVDSIYSRSNTAYLGKFTDEFYGEFNADFMAQMNWPEGLELPATMTNITAADLQLFYSSYYGDSLATLRLQVDTLSKPITDDGTNKNLYYSNLDPKVYCDPSAPPFAVKDYAAFTGVGKGDSVSIQLDDSFCHYLFSKYQENNHAQFKDAAAFINNVLKGFYIHTIGGEGSVLYIDDIFLNFIVEYTVKNSAGTADSVVYKKTSLAATKEVFVSTRFKNNNLQRLTEDPGCTYLKTPAGLYTEVTLPVEEMFKDPEHQTDTLNSAMVTFLKYKESGDLPYRTTAPKSLLMLRKDDMKTFFEANRLYDSKTSFISSYSTTTSGYQFNTLNRLISVIFSEIRPEIAQGEAHWTQWKNAHPNWNKVMLIPVSITYDSNDNAIGIENDMSVTSASLYGGTGLDSKPDDKIKLEVIYTNPTRK